MPGISTSGLANTGDYVIGRGKVFFSTLDANGFPKDFRDLGNCPDFKLSVETESIDHKSSRSGLKVIDQTVIIAKTLKASFTLDEALNFDNLALFFSGGTNALAQAGATITIAAGSVNVKLSGKGKWYDIYDYAGEVTTATYPRNATDAQEHRVYNISAVTVKDVTGGTTHVNVTDYVMDLKMGRIFIPSGSGISGTANIAITFTKPGITVDEMRGLTVAQITGAVKFIQEDAANNSWLSEWHFHAMNLASQGDFGLIGDDYANMQFEGTAQKREAVNALSPTFTVRTYSQ